MKTKLTFELDCRQKDEIQRLAQKTGETMSSVVRSFLPSLLQMQALNKNPRYGQTARSCGHDPRATKSYTPHRRGGRGVGTIPTGRSSTREATAWQAAETMMTSGSGVGPSTGTGLGAILCGVSFLA